MGVTIDIGEIDWELLREQKRRLVAIQANLPAEGILASTVIKGELVSEWNALEGILNFLDHVMDKAAELLGDEIVYDDGYVSP